MKNTPKFLGLLCGLSIMVMMMSGCPSPTGLHNQMAAEVTVILENFPAADGDYSITGDYQNPSWDNSTVDVTLKNGSGTSASLTMVNATVYFTIVPVGSWTRPWFPTTKGNSWDSNSGGKQWNFVLTGLPVGQDVTVTIDGSSNPAAITVE